MIAAKRSLFLALVVGATALAAACSHDDPVAFDPGPTSVPDSVEFDQHVQAIFTSRCALSGCHVGSNPDAGLNLKAGVSYGNIVNVPTEVFVPGVRVTPFQPSESVLYLLVESGDMPGSGPDLSAVQKEIIRIWIEDGAPDN
ncbi:MAG TPA: hypothetical protein VF247_00120 [Candidatus Krumholzibacteria bacterium]